MIINEREWCPRGSLESDVNYGRDTQECHKQLSLSWRQIYWRIVTPLAHCMVEPRGREPSFGIGGEELSRHA